MLELCQHQAPHSCPNYGAKQMASLIKEAGAEPVSYRTHINILMIIRVKYMPGMFFSKFPCPAAAQCS